MNIRKAVYADIDAVERQYDELLNYEKEHGSCTNWKHGVYPTRSVAEKGVGDGSLYVMEENGGICASMLLNHEQLDIYASLPWRHQAAPENVLSIHTLCVPPSQSGRGRGTQMVTFAMEEAQRRECLVIRIDTWEKNEPAARLYRRLRFLDAGKAEVGFGGVISETLIFFEKKI